MRATQTAAAAMAISSITWTESGPQAARAGACAGVGEEGAGVAGWSVVAATIRGYGPLPLPRACRYHAVMSAAAVVKGKAQAGREGAGGAGGAGGAAIEAAGLTKTFGDFHAVKDVSFSIAPGQLVAFLGPNGAGKSTTMRMLTGYLAPSAGSARVAGFDVATERIEAARHIGYLPENGPLYPEMTAKTMLEFVGGARGMSGARLRGRIEAVVAQCRLEQVFTRAISKLSKGYRQRVGMAVALLHEPRVLIMDEPTAGLDPNQVEHVRGVLKELARERTLLLSTHILSEVRALADRVLVVSRGRLVHDGPAASLGKDEREMEKRFGELTK